jgi:hypothetical protein
LCTCTVQPRSRSASPHAHELLAGGHYRVLVRPQVAESPLLPARWRLIGMSVSVLAGVLAALVASHVTL